MERTILHCDCNNFYASVERLYHPELRDRPIAVSGDPELRHGIVLAKSNEAKKLGVKTGHPLWMAKQLCPDIVFVKPHYDLYTHFSQLARNIYSEYTDRVEPYGQDECWLDMTGTAKLLGDGKHIADTIRNRIKSELGITISAGVSFNKVFAKLGSDYKKPDATTVIPFDGFREFVWPLPVSNLIFVGGATTKVLERKCIRTIGELANTDRSTVKSWLGKCGETLWLYANGYDSSQVAKDGEQPTIKSIGNSTTLSRDLVGYDEIKITLMVLSESVAARLRRHNMQCETVQIGIRGTNLSWIERQGRLPIPGCDSTTIYLKALELLVQNYQQGKPVRSLGVRACNLSARQYIQTSFMPSVHRTQRYEKIEDVIDKLRFRFGNKIVQRGIMLSDTGLSTLDPQADHPNLILSSVHTQR
ncbi:MAG: DNA polymerase IV [Oscillospiraceae bacterium]|nr:DNA polymerase IV [Oscillospiraceae bacterium]MDD4414741.1 DNA polymerase IV [Oscillospiraceae bacterium]